MENRKKKFRTDLQGLRAVAILLIIFSHSSLNVFNGGFIGVDVFFVLSGFLITSLLQKELIKSKKLNLADFYARRLKRLLPALLFMIISIFVSAFFLLSITEFKSQVGSANFATTWTSNFYFAFRSIGYFNELASQDLFLHTWSLGVEEQFYVLWPILLIFLFRIRKNQFIIYTNYHLGLLVIFILGLMTSIYWTFNDPITAFYLMPSRIWQFALGGIAYFYIEANNAEIHFKSKYFSTSIVLIGIFCILTSALFFSPNMTYPGYWAIIPSLSSVIIIVAGSAKQSTKNILTHPILVWIGDHSYSLYLWHWPVFILGFSLGYKGQIVPILIMMSISTLLSTFSLKYIEKPFWKGRLSTSRSSIIILTSIFTMVLSLHLIKQISQRLPPEVNNTSSKKNWRQDVPVIYSLNCDEWYFSSKINKCEFGEKLAEKTIVLFGDSILAQWFSILPKLFPEPTWKIIVFTKSSCPLVDEDFIYSRIGKTYQVCTDWRNSVLDELDIIQPDIVIMGNSARYNFTDSQWQEGGFRVIKRISQSSKKVIVIPGTPSLTFDAIGCINRFIPSKDKSAYTDCSVNNRNVPIEHVLNALYVSTAKFNNVDILNLNPLVCPKGVCYSIDNNDTIIFRDTQHLTDTFVKTLIPEIYKKLTALRVYKEDN